MLSEDMEAVCNMETQCFSRPWSFESFEKAYVNPDNIYMVIVDDYGEIIGYCGIWMAGDEGDLCHIGIAPKERGHGYGELLLQEAMAKCRNSGVTKIFLEVRESNAVAIGLYHKMGFCKIGIRPKYYSEPNEDGILMECQL